MRKLLVASQKGGVGKTTTAINLAVLAASQSRVLLIDADPAGSVAASLGLAKFPGRKRLAFEAFGEVGMHYPQPFPNLDVMAPSDEGPASDGNLDAILIALSSPRFSRCYDIVVVDSPPFLGSWPQLLIHVCEEILLVLRAEPLSCRTLPVYLEALQEAKVHSPACNFRGMLLTLPYGAMPGERVEKSLRRDFGGWILPNPIPYDENVGSALFRGRPLAIYNPESKAALAYRKLAKWLGLTAGQSGAIGRLRGEANGPHTPFATGEHNSPVSAKQRVEREPPPRRR